MSEELELLVVLGQILVQYLISFHFGYSPFKVLYGHEPRYFGVLAADMCAVDDLIVWLAERQGMHD
jgi:hypothetical protein